MDVDVIMKWPMKKLYEYMAFLLCEDEEFRKKHLPKPQVKMMSFDEIVNKMGLDE